MKAKRFFTSACHRESAQKTAIVITISSSSVLLFCILREPTGSPMVTSSLWSQEDLDLKIEPTSQLYITWDKVLNLLHTQLPCLQNGIKNSIHFLSFDEDLMNQWHRASELCLLLSLMCTKHTSYYCSFMPGVLAQYLALPSVLLRLTAKTQFPSVT